MNQIFYNGTILTMEPGDYAQAVLVQDGVIRQVGDFEELRSAAPTAQLVDLNHKTMLPAFIDAHSHLSSYASAQLQVPLDEAASFEEIAQRIQSFLQGNRPKAGEWVVAKGYDHNTLAEKRHPTLELLDRIAPENPLVLHHSSGHCGVFNTQALRLLGITTDTPAPAGGVIGAAHNKLTGYLEETAYVQYIQKIPAADFGAMLASYGKAQEKYLSYGITTVQEGMMVAQMVPLYQGLVASGILKVDVVGYPELGAMEELAKTFPEAVGRYWRRFKIGGYKMILDGSPQVKTAWMKAPYAHSNHCGYPAMTYQQVRAAVAKAAEEGVQILAHCNGDAAIQQYIDAVQWAQAQGKNIRALRPVIIHAQLMTREELTQAAELGMIPSFFVAHVLHWGDIHLENFGYQRAQWISPARSALERGVPFTFHQDAPVIEPNMLETIQCAVTRKTKTGITLGAQECITVMEALRAVTVNAAYQYFEEESKGSIRPGKRGNFVVLDANPLTVPKDSISAIRVLQTIQDGETVYALADQK